MGSHHTPDLGGGGDLSDRQYGLVYKEYKSSMQGMHIWQLYFCLCYSLNFLLVFFVCSTLQ
jgi:hypothetical protein